MIEFLRDAGWGIWPVLLFASLSVGLSVRYARRPTPELLRLVVGFSLATLIMGCLGFVTGIQAAARYIRALPIDERWIFFAGVRESLNNLVMAFSSVSVTCLLSTLGSYRAARAAQRTRPIVAL